MYHCEECDDGTWVCGEGGCDEGKDPIIWTDCGTAYIPTAIGFRLAVRVVTGAKKSDPTKPYVKLVPVGDSLNVKQGSEPTKCKDLVEKKS